MHHQLLATSIAAHAQDYARQPGQLPAAKLPEIHMLLEHQKASIDQLLSGLKQLAERLHPVRSDLPAAGGGPEPQPNHTSPLSHQITDNTLGIQEARHIVLTLIDSLVL